MASALFLGQNVYLGFELGMGSDRTRFGDDLAAGDLFLLGAPQEEPDIVAGDGLVHLLVEHLDAGDGGLLGRLQTDYLDLLI